MNDYRFLKTQKNDVLMAIREAGLDPLEFKFSEKEVTRSDGRLGGIQRDLLHQLVHEPSGYGCLFGAYNLSFSPGDTSLHSSQTARDWAASVLAVSAWLKNLIREIDAPDLWGALAQEQELFSAEPAGAVNAPFNAEEQAQIKRAIDEIRVYITTTYTLADEPLRRVHAKLDYLIDASTRLGRIDWKNLFVGALLSLALQQLSSSGPGLRELFAAAGHLFRHVLGASFLLPCSTDCDGV